MFAAILGQEAPTIAVTLQVMVAGFPLASDAQAAQALGQSKSVRTTDSQDVALASPKSRRTVSVGVSHPAPQLSSARYFKKCARTIGEGAGNGAGFTRDESECLREFEGGFEHGSVLLGTMATQKRPVSRGRICRIRGIGRFPDKRRQPTPDLG